MDNLTRTIKNNFRNKVKGKTGAARISAAPKTQQEKLQQQVANYENRLQNIGVNPEKAKDTRNPIEKLLNLKQDQNFIFDIFELINRPQQALFTGIDNAIKGKDFIKGLGEGISGEKTTSGGKILRDLGMEGSGKFNLFDPSSYKEASLSDFLGFGLDIFADPIDLIAAPVKVAGTAGKAVKTADNVSDVLSKGVKLTKTADTIGDTARGIGKASSALNVIGDVGKTSETTWKPLSAALLSYAGKGVKKGTSKVDDILEKVLGKSDAKNILKLEKRAAKTGESLETAAKALNISTTKLDTYKALKNQLGKTVNSSQNLLGLTGKAREAQNIADVNKSIGSKVIDDLNNDINNIVSKTAKSSDEASDLYKQISDALQTHVEKNYDYSIKGKDVLEKLKKNKRIDFFNNDSAKNIVDQLKEYGIKASNDGRYVTLLDDTKKLKTLTNEFANKTFGEYLSAEDLIDRKTAENLLNSSPELQKLAKKAETTFPKLSSTSDTLTGLNTADITKEGYVRHALSDEAKELKQTQGLFPSRNKTFNERTFKGTTAEYNRLKQANLLDSSDNLVESAVDVGTKTTKRGEKAAKSIYQTDDAGNFIRNAKGELVRDDNYQKALVTQRQDKINRLNNELESAKELTKGRTQGLDAIDTSKLTTKDAKSLNTLRAEKQFRDTTESLKKLKYDNVSPQASETIDNLRSSFTDYRKSKTKYVDALKKKNITDDELKVLKETMDKNQKIVTTNIKAAEKFNNKQARELVGNANKAFKEGKSAGVLLEKETQKLAKAQARVNDIYSAAEDLASSLPGQIKYEEAALKKLENSADAIFKSKSKIIEQEAKAANVLMSQEGIEFMNTGFMENLMDYVNRNPNFTKGAQIYNEALATGIFSNNKYVKFAEDIKDKVPYGFTKVDGNQLAKNIEVYKGILPEGSKDLINIAETFKGKTLYMDKELARLTNLVKKGDEAVHPLIKFWDGINNTFKKFSTLTLGFQERNIIGNSTNMVLSGVSAKDLPEYYAKAHSLWNKADDLLEKATNKTLKGAEKAEWESLQEFYKAGFLDAFEKGQGLEAIKESKGALGKVSKASVALNEKVDTYNRLALLLYAKDHPKYVEKLGRKNAVDAVRMVLFDPSNTSELERNVFKRIIPFYTFTKQNLMFQAENLMRNTPRYNKLFKSINKAYDALGEDSYYKYQKEAMQIPLPFKDDKGNQLFLKSNLPVSDLGEFLSEPVKRVVSSTSPIIKTPFEMVTGKSTFTGEDANYNVLSGTLNKLGVRGQGIENTAQAAETILNNFGLQNISTNLIRKVEAILDKDNPAKSDQQLWAEIFRSVLQNTKQENVVNSGLYDQLDQYKSIIKRLKNQGIDVPTMTQINQVNKMKLNNMKNKRARSN